MPMPIESEHVRGKYLYWRVLALRVLAVAAVDPKARDWAVYIAAVPGVSHHKEVHEVHRHGDKTSKAHGEFLFPDLKDKFDWRD